MRTIPTFFWEYKGRQIPEVDVDAYRLRIHGSVDRPQLLSLAELDDLLPAVTTSRRFYCVNGWSLESEWRGYRLVDLMDLVQPNADTPYLRATSLGGYEDTIKIEALIDGDAMLVTHMNGEPLPLKRGKPLRLMVFDIYQFKGVKALGELEVVNEYRPGTWSKVGYSDPTIQPFPHLSIDQNEELMPEPALLAQQFPDEDDQDA